MWKIDKASPNFLECATLFLLRHSHRCETDSLRISQLGGFFTVAVILLVTQRLSNVVPGFTRPRLSRGKKVRRSKLYRDVGAEGSAGTSPLTIRIFSIASSATLFSSESPLRASSCNASIARGSPMYLSAPAA